MQLTRRGFVGGIVASATMAEAGALAELMNWLRRKPVSVMSPAKGWPGQTTAVEDGAATRMWFSRDKGISWEEVKGVKSVDFKMTGPFVDESLLLDNPRLVNLIQSKFTNVTVRGEGFLPPTVDPLDFEQHFHMELHNGMKIDGVLGIEEVAQEWPDFRDDAPQPSYLLRGTTLDPEIFGFTPPPDFKSPFTK